MNMKISTIGVAKHQFIHQNVYKALEKYSSSDTKKELGTILLGEYSYQLDKTHVIISSHIEAKYTDASASTLTFTHESWGYIHKEHASLYPGKKIVGWQHTHSNYGIFLSNYDMFIQQNFFNLPFQVAYVIDPVQNIRGIFQWKNGNVEKLKGFYIYDDPEKPVKIEQKKVISDAGVPTVLKRSKLKMPLLLILCALTIVSLISNFILHEKYNQQFKTLINMSDRLDDQADALSRHEASIDVLQEPTIVEIPETTDDVLTEQLIERIEKQEERIQSQEDEIEVLKKLVDDSAVRDSERVSFMIYIVERGDNLYKICSINDLDYATNKGIILSLNGITDPNQIFVGQNILLPIEG